MLGSELAGRIADNSPIPDGCPFRAGDRVFGAAQGAFGERVAVAWQALVPLPENMTYDQGAGACFARGFALELSQLGMVGTGGRVTESCSG